MDQRQFSLRRLFCVMAWLAIPFAAAGYLVRVQALHASGERAVLRDTAQIEKLGGFITQGNVNGTFYISLTDTPLTDAGLAVLAGDLRAFPPAWLDQDHDIGLGLSGTQITDAGLESLVGVRLRGLSLPAQITDAAVPCLKRLTIDRGLGIHGTQITRAGLTDLETVFKPSRILSDYRPDPWPH